MKFTHALLASLLLFGMTACQSYDSQTATRAPAPELGAYKWELIQLNGQTLPSSGKGTTPHLIFMTSEQRVAGSTGCNRIMGSYTLLDNGSFRLGQLASTRMACPDMATEAAFLEALNNYDRAQFEQGSFSLLNAAGERIARFAAKPLEVQ